MKEINKELQYILSLYDLEKKPFYYRARILAGVGHSMIQVRGIEPSHVERYVDIAENSEKKEQFLEEVYKALDHKFDLTWVECVDVLQSEAGLKTFKLFENEYARIEDMIRLVQVALILGRNKFKITQSRDNRCYVRFEQKFTGMPVEYTIILATTNE